MTQQGSESQWLTPTAAHGIPALLPQTAVIPTRCLSFWCLSLGSSLMIILVFACLLPHLVGWLATCFQSLHERLHINPCHNLLCLLLPLKLLVSPKDLPSVTIHLPYFYAPQLNKHQCLSNPIFIILGIHIHNLGCSLRLEQLWSFTPIWIPWDPTAHPAALSSMEPIKKFPIFLIAGVAQSYKKIKRISSGFPQLP